MSRALFGLGSISSGAALVFALPGCGGVQSTLDPASREAQWVADLFWRMAGGAAVVWLIVIGLAVYALHVRPEPHGGRRAVIMIIGGGVVVPTLVLGGLLAHGLQGLPALVSRAPEGSLVVRVSGEQWWWRVEYLDPAGKTIATANEICLPVGAPVQFELSSPDVIHSFWIPSLGGKVDMIPGRTTYLALHPTRTGTFRGVCAEFCGVAHSYMAFDVEVREKPDFFRWLAHQGRDAVTAPGGGTFLANGCGACHTVRGTPADGLLGPDLTHFGSRRSLAAGTLPNRPENLKNWLTRTNQLKPGVHMPHFGMLTDEEIQRLVNYLTSLK